MGSSNILGMSSLSDVLFANVLADGIGRFLSCCVLQHSLIWSHLRSFNVVVAAFAFGVLSKKLPNLVLGSFLLGVSQFGD